MAAYFGARTRQGVPLNDDEVAQLLADGNVSEIEEFADDDEDFVGRAFDRLDEIGSDSGEDSSEVNEAPPPIPTTSKSRGSTRGRSGWKSKRGLASGRGRGRSMIRGQVSASDRGRGVRRGQVSASDRGRGVRRGQARGRSGTGERVWVETTYTDKAHDYTSLPINQVRTPIEYFRDYFDDLFLQEVARCTNLYQLRETGFELKTTRLEIAKLFAVHIIMGCISYPQLPMYWKTGMKLLLVSETMTRDRFLTLRNALHVVDRDRPLLSEKDNALWKVQPMLNKVKETCNRLERVPGYYSIDEQMIPFTGRCKLRQVVKNKPRPVGLKNFVLTTKEGLMLDFAIYQGAKTMFCNTNLGLGPSVILHLSQSIPPGSCVYHDRYFTTIPLAEEMLKRNLHSTGTIMINRIPDRSTFDFKKDSQMARGETQQFVCNDIAIVKWKDNK